MDGTGTTAWYGILCKCNGFNITGRENVLPTKGLIGKTLNLTRLFPAKGGRDRGIKGTVDVINASNGALTEKMLVKI